MRNTAAAVGYTDTRTVVRSIWITLTLYLWQLVTNRGFIQMTAAEFRQCWVEIYYSTVVCTPNMAASKP